MKHHTAHSHESVLHRLFEAMGLEDGSAFWPMTMR